MKKLLIVVEGDSEERFVRGPLKAHLPPHLDLKAIKVQTGWHPDGSAARGGGDWTKWSADIRACLAPPGERIVTTMFDLYGLPRNFPGLDAAANAADTAQLAQPLEDRMRDEIADERFVPFLLRHEFETLVLAALPQLAELLPRDKRSALDPLQEAVGDDPEAINCGPTTAPSRRLQAADIGFSKLVHGVPAVQAAGISALARACPRFGAWVARLEKS